MTSNGSYDNLLDLASGVLDSSIPLDGSQPSPRDSIDSFSEDFRDYAFKLWAFDCALDFNAVSALLQDNLQKAVSPATLRAWARADCWRERLPGFHQTFVNVQRLAIKGTLQVGAVKAAQALVAMLDDPDVNANAKVRAASLVLGLEGYVMPAVGASAVTVHIERASERLGDMSDEELAALADEYRGNVSNAVSAPVDITQNEYRTAVGDRRAHPEAMRYPHITLDTD